MTSTDKGAASAPQRPSGAGHPPGSALASDTLAAGGLPDGLATGAPCSSVPRWWAPWIGYALCALGLLVLAGVLIGNRHRYNRADFDLYFAWWWQWRHGIDPWLAPAAAPLAPGGVRMPGFCNYTPPFVMLLAPLGALPLRLAYWLWQAAQVSALLGAMALLLHEFHPRLRWPAWAAALGLAMLYPPVHATLHGAQPGLMLLFLAAACFALERHRRPFACALLLALAALLKAYPGALGGYFLFRRRFGVVAGAALFSGLGIVASGIGYWRELVLKGMPAGIPFMAQERMVSILPNLFQLAAHFGRRPSYVVMLAAALAVSAVVVLFGALATARATDADDVLGLCLGLWLAVALLISPMAYDHELPLLIPIYLFAAIGMARRGVPAGIAPPLLAASLVLVLLATLGEAMRSYQLYFVAVLAAFAGAARLAALWSVHGRASHYDAD